VNLVDKIEKFEDNKRVYDNGKTKSASYHLAMTCLSAGLSLDETEEIAKASSNVFFKLMKDTPEDVPMPRFSRRRYVENTMNLYSYLVTECFSEDKNTSDLFEF
jgi:hypothetical protein